MMHLFNYTRMWNCIRCCWWYFLLRCVLASRLSRELSVKKKRKLTHLTLEASVSVGPESDWKTWMWRMVVWCWVLVPRCLLRWWLTRSCKLWRKLERGTWNIDLTIALFGVKYSHPEFQSKIVGYMQKWSVSISLNLFENPNETFPPIDPKAQHTIDSQRPQK